MFENKKIFILGMARSGYEIALVLSKMNNEILLNDLCNDQDSDNISKLKELGVKLVLGEHPDDLFNNSFDYLIKNPGVSNNHKYVLKALKDNIPVINELEVAYHLLPNDINIIGVTGSNGKTTTVTIIYKILKLAFDNVHLTGNIGFPLCSFISKIKLKDIVVTEVSSHQLVNIKDFKVNVAVLTNLSETHLDFFESYATYLDNKKRIFNNHNKKDYAILNLDDKEVLNLSKDIKSNKLYFSLEKVNIKGCYLKNNHIYYFDEKVINLEDIKLKGNHNYENIMASILVAKRFKVNNDVINKALKRFNGVEHRLEYVANIKGVDFYNDSKSTNIKATQIALSSFNKPVILILGGMDRGHSFNELTDYLKHTKRIISYGETKDRIKKFAKSLHIQCDVVNTVEEATLKAYKNSNKGDIILLSPACASWDQFKNFEERGNLFKSCLKNMIERNNL